MRCANGIVETLTHLSVVKLKLFRLTDIESRLCQMIQILVEQVHCRMWATIAVQHANNS